MYLSLDSIRTLHNRMIRKINEPTYKDSLFFTYKLLPEEFSYIHHLIREDLIKKQEWYTPISQSSGSFRSLPSCSSSLPLAPPRSPSIQIPTHYRPKDTEPPSYLSYNISDSSSDNDADDEDSLPLAHLNITPPRSFLSK